MPKVTIYAPNDIHDKINKIAQKNDESFSSVICRMAYIGLMVEERKNQKNKSSDKPEIDVYCQKLILQINALLKSISAKQMGYTDKDFDKLRDATLEKYNELCGVEKEEL